MKGTRISLYRSALLPALLLALGLARHLPAAQGQYDPPDFDRSVFEVDGLSIPPKAREELVEALTALARNFPWDQRVDSDLMEKALAIALRLDPLHPGAREAHTALSQGEAPGKTGMFESLTAISEALWQRAARLAGPEAELDDALLAPYLMELSLLAHPDPPPDRVRRFASLVKTNPPAWEKTVVLQPEENNSSMRSAMLYRAIEPEPSETPPPAEPATPSAPDPDGNGTVEIRLSQTEIGFLACDTSEVAVGIARLTVRVPDSADLALSGDSATADSLEKLELKLSPPRNGPPILGSEIVESTVRKRFPDWPRGKIGRLSFYPEIGEAPGELSMSLAGSLLLESAFSGETLAPDVVVAGVLGEDGVPVLGVPDSILPKIVSSVARLTDKPYLLLPTSVDIEMLGGEGARLGLKPQVIGFASYEELRSLVWEQTRSLNCREAVGHFAAIVELTEEMGLEKVLQTAELKDRLELILSLWPNHLSAKAMVARLSGETSGMPEAAPGSRDAASPAMPTGPDAADARLSAAQSNAQIHRALMPLLDFASNDGVSADEGLQRTRQANETLAALRPQIDSVSQNVFLAAQRIVKGFEELAAAKTRGSTVWNQRLENLRGLAANYRLEQAALGTEHSFDL